MKLLKEAELHHVTFEMEVIGEDCGRPPRLLLIGSHDTQDRSENVAAYICISWFGKIRRGGGCVCQKKRDSLLDRFLSRQSV